MRNGVTKREPIPGNIEDYVGCIASTNLTATMRAKLVATSRELCLFETSPTPYEALRERGYDCVVGETFTLPTRDVLFMHFPIEENPNLPIYENKKANKKRKRGADSN